MFIAYKFLPCSNQNHAMKVINSFVWLFLFSCASNVVTEAVEIRSPQETYKKWIQTRINCDHKASLELMSEKTKAINSAAEMEIFNLFDCAANDYKLGDFNAILIPIDTSDEIMQRYFFEFSVINLTQSDTIKYEREYTFEFEDEDWKLVYLGNHIDKLEDSLLRSDYPMDYTRLDTEIKSYLQIDPFNSMMHYYHAACLMNMDDMEGAEKSLARAIDLCYNIPAYYYSDFAEVYVMKKDYEKGILYSEKAIQVADNSLDSAFNFAIISFCYSELSRQDSAEYFYTKGIECDPLNFVVNEMIGDLHASYGKPKQALLFYDRYYEFDPKNAQELPAASRKMYISFLIKCAEIFDHSTDFLRRATDVCDSFEEKDEDILKYLNQIENFTDQE